MGRRPTIDREGLLDAADRVIAKGGVTSLTIDAVAREAGVSKGGVLYSFGTKDALIEAMLERAGASYEGLVAAYLAAHGDEPHAAAAAHVDASHREDRLAAHASGQPAWIVANNKAEGSAPLTLELLAREIAARSAPPG